MSLTDAQYAAFIDRLINCREAEDAARAATKQVYAELADAGEDKTIAGLVVRQQRMTAKDRVKADMRDAAAEDGQSRYLRGKASHVRAREGSKSGHDPMTGEVNEPDAALRPQTGGTETLVNQSTAARMDVHLTGRASRETAEDSEHLPTVQPAGTQAPPVDTNPLSSAALPRKTEDRGVVAALHSSAPVTSSYTVEGVLVPLTQGGVRTSSAGTEGEADRHLISNPVTAPAPQVTVDAGRESASDPSALPVVRHDHSKPHPDCQDPEDCGLASWTHMCGGCLRARAAKEASVALQ